MSHSPLAPHAATPAELRERIEAERRGTPFLVYRDGDGDQAIVDLGPAGERIAIGRRESNEVPLPWDTEVSRVHAELERVGDDWAIVDDGLSRNGSWVNGTRITGRHRLQRRRRAARRPDHPRLPRARALRLRGHGDRRQAADRAAS